MSIALIVAALLAGQDPTGSAAIDACRGPGDPLDETHAQDAADCLIGALYAPGQLESLDPLGADAPRLFSRAALAAIEAARLRSGGQAAPGLDVDPFCGCQDPSGLTVLATSTSLSSDGTGFLTVILTSLPVYEEMGVKAMEALLEPGARTGVRLDIVHEGDGWRIDDIMGETGASLRQVLQP